jgi:hypothetical protein
MTAQHPPAAFKLTRRHVLIAAALIFIAVALVEGYRAWRIVQDVRAGREFLRAGEMRMDAQRLDASDADLDHARHDFETAGEKFRSAGDALGSDPAVFVARRLPWLGVQIDAADALTDIGQDGAVIGVAGVDAIRAFDAARARDDATLTELTPTLIASVDPYIAEAEAALARIDAGREPVGDESLLAPLRSAFNELDERRARLRDMFESYRLASAFAPEFLGFDGSRTYLVMAQNNAEMLPTGGLVSVVGTLTIDRGRVAHMEFQDAVQMGDDWIARSDVYIEPPAPLKQYLLKDMTWNLTSSNWSPDFPTSARNAARFFELQGGHDVDGVIAVNVTTLEQLLAVTGPVEIDEFDVTVDTNNAFDLTEQHTRIPYEPAADRKEFAALLADEVLQRVLHPQAGQWSPLVETVQRLGDSKDLMLFSFDDDQQSLIEQMAWDGGVSVGGESATDYLMVVDASVNSSKLNAVVERSADIDVQLAEDGTATTTVSLDYDNDLSAWARGRDPQLVEKLMLGGMYGGYVRLLTPKGSRIVAVTDGEDEIGIEEISSEQGLAVFGRFFALQADDTQRLTFTYVTPPVVAQHGDAWTYTLRLQRQSGWDIAVDLNVAPPPGMRRTTMLIDGKPAGDEATEIDLTTDRTITMTFEQI